MEEQLIAACKRLRLGSNLVPNAKRIKKKGNLEFLLELFTAELEERDLKRRNGYVKTAGFKSIKTFEKYTFEDIKFPASLTPEDLTGTTFIPRRENLILCTEQLVQARHISLPLWGWPLATPGTEPVFGVRRYL